MAHWVEVAQRQGKAAAIEGGQRGSLPGERRRLSPEQEALIRTLLLDTMPDQLKLAFVLWTREAVQALIALHCGFQMPIRTVGEYLKRWSYTPQRPLKRAYQQQLEVIQRWLKTEYPKIEQRAKAEGGEILWGRKPACAAIATRGVATPRQGERRYASSVEATLPRTGFRR